MFDIIGHLVVSLTRIRLGKLSLGDLAVGSWRHLTSSETSWVQEMAEKSREGIES